MVLKARWGGSCLACGRKIPRRRQVRYWFDRGITCRTCTLPET